MPRTLVGALLLSGLLAAPASVEAAHRHGPNCGHRGYSRPYRHAERSYRQDSPYSRHRYRSYDYAPRYYGPSYYGPSYYGPGYYSPRRYYSPGRYFAPRHRGYYGPRYYRPRFGFHLHLRF